MRKPNNKVELFENETKAKMHITTLFIHYPKGKLSVFR